MNADIVAKCRTLAAAAHAGKVRKRADGSSVDYFTGHVEKVAELVGGDLMKAVAYLHDVVEDHSTEGYSAQDLVAMEVPLEVIGPVLLLTKTKGARYGEYIRRLLKSGDMTALEVKRADVSVNLADSVGDLNKWVTDPASKLVGTFETKKAELETRVMKYELALLAIEAKIRELEEAGRTF